MYVHPDAQLVEIIDGEEFYSCDPIGFSNYMISRNGTLINRTTGKIRIPKIVETTYRKSKRTHAIVNLRQYEYRKTFDMTRIMGIMFVLILRENQEFIELTMILLIIKSVI